MSKQEDSFRPPIKLIRLKNIQSLPFAEIEPAPSGKLTVIVGGSDTGKTTLASRALRKLFFNDIPTKEIVRRKCKDAHISAFYDTPDNLAISWYWKGRNTDSGKAWWQIDRDGMETVVLEGGGRQGHVPEAIQDITGVRPVVIGGTTLNFNFNKQLDGPFLGDKSPNERYRVLGILAGTLEVDTALKEVGVEIIRGRKQETVLDKEIAALEEEVDSYAWLEILGGDIKKVEAALVEVGRKQGLRDKLAGILNGMRVQQDAWDNADTSCYFLEQSIRNAGNLLALVEAKSTNYQKLTTAQTNITTQNEILSGAENILTLTNRTTEAQNILTQTDSKHTLSGKLISLSDQVSLSSAKLATAQKIIADTESVPEISTTLTTITEKNNKLTTLKRLQKDIQSEAAKITQADTILRATESHKKATERLEGLSESNHARSSLLGYKAGIAKCVEAIKGYAEIVALTVGVEEGKEALGRVEAGMAKAKKLRELTDKISIQTWDLAHARTVLTETEGVGRGSEALAHVEAGVGRLSKLTPFPGQIRVAAFNVDSYSGQVRKLTEGIEVASGEYRALLLEAGICEGCKVVGEVVAAVG